MEAEAEWDEKIRSLVRNAVPRKYGNVALTDDTSLQRELGLDSLAIIALIFRFEEMFGIDLPQLEGQVDFSRMRTLGDLLEAGRSIRQIKAAGPV